MRSEGPNSKTYTELMEQLAERLKVQGVTKADWFRDCGYGKGQTSSAIKNADAVGFEMLNALLNYERLGLPESDRLEISLAWLEERASNSVAQAGLELLRAAIKDATSRGKSKPLLEAWRRRHSNEAVVGTERPAAPADGPGRGTGEG